MRSSIIDINDGSMDEILDVCHVMGEKHNKVPERSLLFSLRWTRVSRPVHYFHFLLIFCDGPGISLV